MKKILLLALMLFSTGCANLQSVSFTQVPENRNKKIKVEESSWGILAIFFTNSFVDTIPEKLRQQCPTGKITGVYTKYHSRYYILWLTRYVEVEAFCVNESPKVAMVGVPQ